MALSLNLSECKKPWGFDSLITRFVCDDLVAELVYAADLGSVIAVGSNPTEVTLGGSRILASSDPVGNRTLADWRGASSILAPPA